MSGYEDAVAASLEAAADVINALQREARLREEAAAEAESAEAGTGGAE